MEYSYFYLIFWINLPRHRLRMHQRPSTPVKLFSCLKTGDVEGIFFDINRLSLWLILSSLHLWHLVFESLSHSSTANVPSSRLRAFQTDVQGFHRLCPRELDQAERCGTSLKKDYYVNLLIAEINHRGHLFWGTTRKSTGEWKKIDKAATDSGW